jgi:hypothetical protein
MGRCFPISIFDWRNTMTHLKKFAVTYTIDYTHRVIVGVTTADAETAEKIASDAFDEASIWDNTPEMPLLFDDYEEVDGETLCFSSEEFPEFPEPDSSVKDLKQKEFAYTACQALLAGEVDTARDFARKALPHSVDSYRDETTGAAKIDTCFSRFFRETLMNKKVLITVSGGVPVAFADPGVDVVIVDFDDFKDIEPNDMIPIHTDFCR